MAQFYVQGPTETIEYQILWSEVIPENTTISTSEWSGDGVVLTNEALDGSFTAVFVSGGLVGKMYTLKNSITLDNNEVYDDSIFIYFEEK